MGRHWKMLAHIFTKCFTFQYFCQQKVTVAQFQGKHTSGGWGSMDHSADYVELAMYSSGSELLKPFVKNTDLHFLMLEAAGVTITSKKDAAN
jgi:hypothetical protein